MIPAELRQLTDQYFLNNKNNYDFSTVEGCGKYIEALIPYAQSHGYPKVGFLLYNGGGTKYNGHRIDSFLYNEVTENGKLQSCDVIANAETNHASAGWSPDEPRYSEDDWGKDVPNSTEPDVPKERTVPYKGYEGDGYWHDQVGRVLYWDYTGKTYKDELTNSTRAGRPGLDSMSSIWIARTIHDIKMEGLTPEESLNKHRAEWCAELRIPVMPVPPEVFA